MNEARIDAMLDKAGLACKGLACFVAALAVFAPHF